MHTPKNMHAYRTLPTSTCHDSWLAGLLAWHDSWLGMTPGVAWLLAGHDSWQTEIYLAFPNRKSTVVKIRTGPNLPCGFEKPQ